jgi:hypothetical protein
MNLEGTAPMRKAHGFASAGDWKGEKGEGEREKERETGHNMAMAARKRKKNAPCKSFHLPSFSLLLS